MRRRRLKPTVPAAFLLSACMAGAPAAWAQSPASAASPASPKERLIPLEVNINSTPGGTWLLLERDGILYAPAEAFEEWRLVRRPGASAIPHQGKTWFPLSSLPGFEIRMNLSTQSVDLVFSPTAFTQSRVSQPTAAERAQAVPAEPALFLNFDTNLSSTKPRGGRADTDLGVLAELGAATRWGLLTSSHVGRHIVSSGNLPRTFHRLETTFTRNLVEQGLTFRAGDSTTRTGLILRPVYYGGLELGRNFGLTPGFITQPIPVLAGTSSAPSTVELYVNDALRQTARVPSGPFVIDNFPLLTGAGQARLVVRDVLGRESVIVQSFFTHSSLLEEGLSDWSVASGAVRRNLGTASSDYGKPFVHGLWRHGFSKTLTLDLNGQVGRDRQTLATGIVTALPFQTLGLAGLALSRDETRGAGRHWLLGLEHNSLRHGFSLNYQAASRNYVEIGTDAETLPNAREMAFSYSYSDERLGSLGIGLARVETYDQGNITTYSVNYSVALPRNIALTLSATRVKAQGGGTSLSAHLSVPLDNRVTASAFASRRSGQNEGYVAASKGVNQDSEVGWRVLAGSKASDPYAEGGVYYEGTRIMLSGDVSASSAQQAMRLGARGSLVYMDGDVFAARRLTNSFALVEVPGYPNVGIGLHGRVQARTNDEGRALLSGLMPFRANSIQIDPTELPISAELDNIEQIVVPPERSGVKVTFPVRSGRGALIKIVFDDGEPAPAGAQLELVGDKQEFFVARRGEAFVTGLQAKNELRLHWRGATCSFTVDLPAGKVDEIARVGPLACRGIKR